MVALNYESSAQKRYGQFLRVVQMLRLQIWQSSSANVTCPSAMHDGAARLVERHLAEGSMGEVQTMVLRDAFQRLISRDPGRAWTSGQWMTERSGGSDVSRTETAATLLTTSDAQGLADAEGNIPLGPYSISGFKWFSSAAESGMTVLLARTEPHKGLSAFLAPTRRHNPSISSPTGPRPGTEMNGVRISRLKNKLGTQSLPTAELELDGMRGWMVGQEGKGIQEIATMLTITRVHSTVGALGYLGRGLSVARAYALVREVGGGKGRRVKLCATPLHMRTLASVTGEYHCLMLLTYYTIYLLGLEERGATVSTAGEEGTASVLAKLTPPAHLVSPLLRVLSSLHKSYCCKHAVPALFSCMEALGGVGYLLNEETEYMNVARLYRDCCVLPIWEGTTDVLATDTIRALKHPVEGPKCIEALSWIIDAAAGTSGDGLVSKVRLGLESLVIQWQKLQDKIKMASMEQLLPEARDLVFGIAQVLIGLLVCVDAASDGAPEAKAMATRFLAQRGFASLDVTEDGSLRNGLDMDCRIVYGNDWQTVVGQDSSKL
jgi:alkylation response protein AidB-like acyl-CoA dehydrogenase